MLIENGIAEAIQFFHLDASSSLAGLKVDFDLQLTLMASWLYRLLAQQVGGTYAHAEAKTLYHHLLEVSVRHIGDVGVSSGQGGDPLRIRIDPRDAEPAACELDRQGQSDVPLAHDRQAGCLLLDLRLEAHPRSPPCPSGPRGSF